MSLKDTLKRIPFLRNVDFDDPATRKSIAKFAVAGVGLLSVLMLSMGGDGEKEAEEETEKVTSTMDMPAGEDNDILEAGDVIDARHRTRAMEGRRTYADIYDGGGESEDPMAPVNNPDGYRQDVFAETEAVIADAMAGRTREQPAEQPEPKAKPRSGGGGGGATAKTPQQAAAERAEVRKREMMREAGLLDENGNRTYDPNDALMGAYEKEMQAQQQPPQQPPQQPEGETKEKPAVEIASVRHSGDISSMSSGGGSGSLSSLKKKNQFVSTDKEHLFKVMFPTSEKIVSGQRVSLRLLEDMVVDGVLVPANTFLTAIVTFDSRLTVLVSSIEFNGKIHPIRYEGYDTDGMRGLYCPASTKEDLKKDAGREARNLGTSLLGSSVGSVASQVISSGVSLIERAKGQQEISITAGYTFFLKEMKEGYY